MSTKQDKHKHRSVGVPFCLFSGGFQLDRKRANSVTVWDFFVHPNQNNVLIFDRVAKSPGRTYCSTENEKC
ncbi:hypothetical protein KAJ77_09935, partial [bacterium]|nr:hypothetical protein [bacterium]